MTKFEAVIFDWAGTLIDFGSFAPMGAFVEAFKAFGVEVSIADARGPMGAPKRDHIRAMMAAPHIAEAWRTAQGSAPDEAAIDRLYEVFVPLNEEVVARYATLVPGADATLDWLRAQGIRIGTTTGYTRSIMARVLPVAADQGFAPEVCICADDVPKGRPGPWQMYRAFADMTLLPGPHIVKVDDTPPGIEGGRGHRLYRGGRHALGQYRGADAGGAERPFGGRARRDPHKAGERSCAPPERIT